MTREVSRFLSYTLRHAPEEIGVVLDAQGWTDVDDLLLRSAEAGRPFSRDVLLRIVADSDKQRFTLSSDGRRIRAAQGHSVAVDLGLEPGVPPALLFHGTAGTNLASILAEGLKPGSRQKVHLSGDIETAVKVGRRHGVPVVLQVNAAAMIERSLSFWKADNGVWLTNHVPPAFLALRNDLASA